MQLPVLQVGVTLTLYSSFQTGDLVCPVGSEFSAVGSGMGGLARAEGSGLCSSWGRQHGGGRWGVGGSMSNQAIWDSQEGLY